MWTVVKNLDLSIRAARCNTSTIRVEFNISNHTCVVSERMNLLIWINVPKSHSLIVTSWGNHSCIIRELSSSDPIRMTFEGLNKFALNHRPHLDSLIIWSWKQVLSISIELNTFHRCGMPLEDIGEGFSVVVPQSDCVILGARSYLLSIRVHSNIIDTALVTKEFLWARIWLQAPSHYLTIGWTWYKLFEIGVENDLSDLVFVALERSKKHGWKFLKLQIFVPFLGLNCQMLLHHLWVYVELWVRIHFWMSIFWI